MTDAGAAATILRLAAGIAIAASLAASLLAQSPSFPSETELMQRVRSAVMLDYELQAGYTYIERRRDVKVSRLGKVTVGPLRTFEVFPSSKPGGTYKRLIAVDGKPLDPPELARRDAEHERDLREAEERERTERPQQRALRMKKEEEERAEREAILDDAFAVFQPAIVGRDTIDGQPVLVIDLSPRAAASVRTRHGRWMKQFAGRMWVGERDYQAVRIDMRATDDVTIGWGIVGRVHQGSRFVFARRRFGDVWLPAETIYDVSGRTLLFRKFQFTATTTYSDYRRLTGDGDRREPAPVHVR